MKYVFTYLWIYKNVFSFFSKCYFRKSNTFTFLYNNFSAHFLSHFLSRPLLCRQQSTLLWRLFPADQ